MEDSGRGSHGRPGNQEVKGGQSVRRNRKTRRQEIKGERGIRGDREESEKKDKGVRGDNLRDKGRPGRPEDKGN